MEIRLLKSFIAVAEELNFRKAADRLNMSQPPLTRNISQLEDELRVKLFKRTTRSVELTGAGLHLLKRSRDLLEQISVVEREVRSLQQSKTSKLYVCLLPQALHSDFPRLISSFKEQFPKISVVMIDASLKSIPSKLKSNALDIAFGVGTLHEPEIKQTVIHSQELGLLVRYDHPLARRKAIQLSDLEGETLIFHGKHEHLGFQEKFIDYLKLRGIRSRVYYKKFKESCGTLVLIGKGLVLSTKNSAHRSSEVVFIPFADYSPHLKILASWSTENHSVPLKAFIEFVEQVASVPDSQMDGHLS